MYRGCGCAHHGDVPIIKDTHCVQVHGILYILYTTTTYAMHTVYTTIILSLRVCIEGACVCIEHVHTITMH